MGLITKDYTFSAGAVIVAAEHNSNFNTIYNEFNGSISNANIASNAAIADTKLASITTTGKVNATALAVTSQAQGDILYASSATVFSRLGAGTAGQALTTGGAAANPAWGGMTTQGDVEFRNSSTRTRLAAGTAGQFLRSGGSGADVTWVSGAYIKTGSYTGDGSDSRSITIGFADTSISPKFVMVKGSSTQLGVWKGADSHSSEVTSHFESSADIATDAIQSFAANSFVVGTNAAVNTNSATYHWMAIGTP